MSMMRNDMVDAVNTLGRFCGMRDVPVLTPDALEGVLGTPQADVMVLFGGSILCGGDVLAQAIRDGVARRYIIVGGEGHTTQSLRDRVHALCPEIATDGQPEAVVFAAWLERTHGLSVDALECRSTNCGNNITNLLDLLRERAFPCRSIILTQDATMQRRMDAGLRLHAPLLRIVNYASYRATLVPGPDGPVFDEDIPGMWDVERYVTLLMGEIPRLSPAGYGPQGKGYIAHVEIPDAVRSAFAFLQARCPGLVREANPLYAS